MSDIINFAHGVRPVATEQELVEFVNKVRDAGGANIIDALFPAYPDDPFSCLIALALNFDCEVNSIQDPYEWTNTLADYPHIDGYIGKILYPDRDHPADVVWVMMINHGSYKDSILKAKAIGEKLNLACVGNQIVLPEHIANAAKAFDAGLAFDEYNQLLINEQDDFDD